MDIWMTLKKALDLYPDRVAVVDGDRSFTYAEIGDRVAGLARFFQAQAIQPEDRISILEVNSHAFLETYYAAAGIGAILNPINYRLAAREVAYILRDSGTCWLVTGFSFHQPGWRYGVAHGSRFCRLLCSVLIFPGHSQNSPTKKFLTVYCMRIIH